MRAERRSPAPRPVTTALSAAALLAGPYTARAQVSGGEPDPIAVTRLSFPVALDGVVDEPGWQEIEPLPMTMYSPVYSGRVTERTHVRLAHDDEYLYVAGRMYDSEPHLIRTNTLYRDVYSGDDLLAVVIDSYNDYETAVWFVTNPAGVRNDRTMSNDAEFSQGMPMNMDWNSHWEVRTSRDETGWAAEFRIPFSTLGFQAVGGRVTMGLISYRFIPRKNERQTFPAIEPRWGRMGFAKPSRARRITMSGVRQRKPVYVTPFALGGAGYLPILESACAGGQAWTSERELTREAGVDLRWSPASNLNLDFTVNTDFAQAEADEEQVNLTRFPLFYPEKRQFFQERASTFQFGTGGFTDRLFHSRRIGLEDGGIVRIYAGARAVGRIGGLDFGLLDMQLAGRDGATGDNLGVLRLSQQVLNPYSSVGGMMTTRLGSGGRNNLAYALDLSLRPFGDEYLIAKWARTEDEAITEGAGLDASLLVARWERRRDEGFSYQVQGRLVGPDYEPGLGFQARRDFLGYGGELGYRHLMPDRSSLQSVSLVAGYEGFRKLDDRSAESMSLAPAANLEFRTGHDVEIGVASYFEHLDGPVDIAGVEVPGGEHRFREVTAELRFPRSTRIRGNYVLAGGSFYDGSRIGVSANPTVNFSRHLEIEGGYEVNRLSFPERSVGTTTHVGRLKVQTAYDAHLSFSAFVQYSNVAELTSVNARLRYHFGEGTDLWIVWTEGLNVERDQDPDPRLPLSAGRRILIKYAHALIL